ncbi:hypothetical protein P9314_21450 [Paenibacillus validus]|uniref:hypothetical protein n=1 Tax=Paenibacillus validus TaxID=44253 RepID=UPI001FD2DE6E|nr:hypothetical protein [Paenibacillus validus]MED4603192.1 hypothetical protein [Paenibacillus validus]MED4609167.1 hypothetical protein [Paenibacillus validus]
MMNAPYPAQPQTVFELDVKEIDTLTKCKAKIHAACVQHMHRHVRVQMVHGGTHEGIMVHIDHYYVYLQVLQGHSRAFLPYPYFPYDPYYSNVILPLALFDLLAIALIV